MPLNLRNQLKRYKALEGEWPKNLNELKEWTGAPLPKLPSGLEYKYDSETGEVSLLEGGE